MSRDRGGQILIDGLTWRRLIAGLASRGRASRESGAFLLGPALGTAKEVTRVVFYDDLDATCLTGGITFSGSGYSRLWELCRTAGLRVLADVHTHPQSWVRQSRIDTANPMIAQRGHVALIVPNYAQGTPMLEACGVFRYCGDKQWESLPAEADAGTWILVTPMTLLERAIWTGDRLRMWWTRRTLPYARERS